MLAGVLAGLVLVEIVLQAAAWVVYRTARQAAPADLARPAVLCVGDSFTYGSGSSRAAHAYPQQLAQRLAAAGDARSVINAGWPGRSSAEVMERLPGLLAKHRPETVCVLVGMNDRWNRDVATDADDAHAGWQWRWRTRRLMEIAWQAWRDHGRRPGSGGEVEGLPAPAALSAVGDAALAAIDRDLDDPARAEDARNALAAYRDTIRVTRDAPLAAEIVRLLARSGAREAAVEDGLAALARLGPDAALCREVAAPLARLSRGEEALRYAGEAVRRAPADARNWRVLNQAERLGGDPGRAILALARGYGIDGDAGYVLRQLRRRDFARTLPTAFMDIVTADLPLGGRTRDEFMELLRTARQADAFEPALRENLERIVRLVRDAGARPVLLTYPHAGVPESVDLVIAEAAEETGATLIDLVPVFTAAARDRPGERLHVADGHCNDAGYALVADVVGRRLHRVGAMDAPD